MSGRHDDDFTTEAEALGLTPDELAGLADAVAPKTPPRSLRTRLLATAARAPRFERFVPQVSELLDISPDGARGLLARLGDPASWTPEMPNIEFFWVEGGPAVENAVRGFLRVGAGLDFPVHGHVGPEVVLVIQGAFIEADGTRRTVGDIVHMGAGTEHGFYVPEDGPDLMMLSVVQEAYLLGGQRFGPREP